MGQRCPQIRGRKGAETLRTTTTKSLEFLALEEVEEEEDEDLLRSGLPRAGDAGHRSIPTPLPPPPLFFLRFLLVPPLDLSFFRPLFFFLPSFLVSSCSLSSRQRLLGPMGRKQEGEKS